MKTPLQIIADLGCPTNSYIAAVQYLTQKEDVDKFVYEQRIADIVNAPKVELESWYFARVMFMYLVQETLRAYTAGEIPNMDELYNICSDKSRTYIESNPWNELRFNLAHGLAVRDLDDEEGSTPSKKGAKKEVTEKLFKDLKTSGKSRQEIIDAFVEQVGMSKAGATTYFHSLKKEFGFSEKTNPNKEVPKAESKQELAERLYQEATDKSKPAMIALLTEKLGTSKLGAQTYYYACKKKFDPKEEEK